MTLDCAAIQTPGGSQVLEQAVICRRPSLKDSAVYFNRLLKFALPVSRNYQAQERFLTRHLHPPKLSKKDLESLPAPVLETMVMQLLQSTFPSQDALANRILTLLMLLEESTQFGISNWITQEIRLLGYHDAGRLHSYYFEGQLDGNTLKTLLSQNGYRTAFIESAMAEAVLEKDDDPTRLLMPYLADRFLSHPLPWIEFLEAFKRDISAEEQQAFPLLLRLYDIHRLLRESHYYDQLALTPQTLTQACADLTALMETLPFQGLSVRHQVVRPVRELVIVEGATEEMLLPQFAKSMGIDFFRQGILLHPAGGKNQAMQTYLKYAEMLRIPIFILMDCDARDQVAELRKTLRPGDRIFLLEEGEFEDTYDLNLVLKTINLHYRPHPKVTREYFQRPAGEPTGRVQILKALWKEFNLGDFDKTGFAARLSETLADSLSIAGEADQPLFLPPSMRQLIEEILALSAEARHD